MGVIRGKMRRRGQLLSVLLLAITGSVQGLFIAALFLSFHFALPRTIWLRARLPQTEANSLSSSNLSSARRFSRLFMLAILNCIWRFPCPQRILTRSGFPSPCVFPVALTISPKGEWKRGGSNEPQPTKY